jgi:hypothetical protein
LTLIEDPEMGIEAFFNKKEYYIATPINKKKWKNIECYLDIVVNGVRIKSYEKRVGVSALDIKVEFTDDANATIESVMDRAKRMLRYKKITESEFRARFNYASRKERLKNKPEKL